MLLLLRGYVSKHCANSGSLETRKRLVDLCTFCVIYSTERCFLSRRNSSSANTAYTGLKSSTYPISHRWPARGQVTNDPRSSREGAAPGRQDGGNAARYVNHSVFSSAPLSLSASAPPLRKDRAFLESRRLGDVPSREDRRREEYPEERGRARHFNIHYNRRIRMLTANAARSSVIH